jgi:xanthine dehydrogenase YagR molybdenum-binding subunit
MALQEETVIDHHLGRIMNASIAEYHVPVNAEAHDGNPLGIVGPTPTIANAVCHATGKRVRDLPITLDKLQR